MDQSFSRLFRASKFASLDLSGRQVLTTPQTLRTVGEWGTKRSLPRNLKTVYIRIPSHDDAYKRTVVKGATGDVGAMMRWKENFPPMKKGFALPEVVEEVGGEEAEGRKRFEEPPLEIQKVSEVEFERLVKYAKSVREEWIKAVEAGQYTRDEWDKFLNVRTATRSSKGGQSTMDDIRFRNSYRQEGEGISFVHPPVYRTRTPSTTTTAGDASTPTPMITYKVKGRVLNKVDYPQQGYAIGVAGYVAFLPLSEVGKDRRPVSGMGRNSLTENELMEFY
ncbi:hypothetical protein HK102_008048, partial [Quaeritorhiza haematococci]